MNKDFLDPINAVGMPNQFDSLVALDFLITAKSAVRNSAMALTEIATPEIRATVEQQMEAALDLHDKISDLMMKKGWFHPYNLSEQHLLDLKAAQTTVQIAEMQLFPEDTSRLGTFATPDK